MSRTRQESHGFRGQRVFWLLVLGLSHGPGIHGQTKTQGNSPSSWAHLRLEEIDTSSSGNPGFEERLERIRAMYVLAADEGDWLERAKDSLTALQPSIPKGSKEEVAFEAYRGALEVVRAKHSRWPPNKLKYLGNGAEILDDLVARHPDNLEVRYLRLASYIFLPSFLRRDDSLAADLGTLTTGLPDQPGAFSPPVYKAVLQFVLENGALDREQRVQLERALQGELQHNG